ncbi:hypothetical protein BDP27DRAFT_218280 [Rhodocollybia butyracea]|uniref:Uncharacterized protein n=1 Tax=Rhodocollybia butyracea TaxID=206335 RepID=A0A9P5UDC5_9AGAR|nr:hypothetical protein BDP27DRAFT_218280 [Rhodocollybia butyracea]
MGKSHCAIHRSSISCGQNRFCFEFLTVWTTIVSPSTKWLVLSLILAGQNIADHNYQSWYGYQKHFLPLLRTSSSKPLPTDQMPLIVASVHDKFLEKCAKGLNTRGENKRRATDRASSSRKWMVSRRTKDFYSFPAIPDTSASLDLIFAPRRF